MICSNAFVKTTEAILMTSYHLCLIRCEINKYISEQFRRKYDLVRANFILFQQICSMGNDILHYLVHLYLLLHVRTVQRTTQVETNTFLSVKF